MNPFDQPDPEAAPVSLVPETATQAFNAAQVGYTLLGAPLFKWSDSRRIAAQSMGLRWENRDESLLDQLRAGVLYDGALRDTLIVCWVCSLPNASEQTETQAKTGGWTVQRAGQSRTAADEEMVRWAAKKDLIDTGGAAFAEAYRTFLAIVLGVAVSEFDLADTGGSAEPGTPSPNA